MFGGGLFARHIDNALRTAERLVVSSNITRLHDSSVSPIAKSKFHESVRAQLAETNVASLDVEHGLVRRYWWIALASFAPRVFCQVDGECRRSASMFSSVSGRAFFSTARANIAEPRALLQRRQPRRPVRINDLGMHVRVLCRGGSDGFGHIPT